MNAEARERLLADGWRESRDPFWKEEPCFYHLSRVKTVILFRDTNGRVLEELFFWKYESQPVPEYLDRGLIEIRRYKLHHSMNALLWHDYGDRKIVH